MLLKRSNLSYQRASLKRSNLFFGEAIDIIRLDRKNKFKCWFRLVLTAWAWVGITADQILQSKIYFSAFCEALPKLQICTLANGGP